MPKMDSRDLPRKFIRGQGGIGYVTLAIGCVLLFTLVEMFRPQVVDWARTVILPEISHHMDHFNSSRDKPWDIGSIMGSQPVDLNIKIQFEATSANGHPNLLQTDHLNRGIRVELSGRIVELLFPDPTSPNHLAGFQLLNNFRPGRWYTLRLNAWEGHFIRARISGGPQFQSASPSVTFGVGDLKIGDGFDANRRFRGALKNIVVRFGIARSEALGLIFYFTLELLLLSIFFATAYFGFRHVREDRPPKPLKISGYDPLLTLRGFACLMVLVGHGFMIVFRPATLLPDLRSHSALWLMTSSPWAGVWIFFTLSGYLMGKGFFSGRYAPDAHGIWTFYSNRSLKIIPLYWTTVLIVSVLMHPQIFYPKNLWMLFSVLLFNYAGNLPINPIGALWSVSTEVGFYLAVPFIFALIGGVARSPRKFPFLVGAVLLSGAFYRYLCLHFGGMAIWYSQVYTPLVGNLDLFLTGFLANAFVEWCRARNITLRFGVPAGFGVLAGMYLLLSYVSARGMLLNLPHSMLLLLAFGPTFTAVGAATVIALFEVGIKPSDGTAWSWLGRRTEFFGLLTYAVYVWHEPIFLAAAAQLAPIQTMPQACTLFAGNILKVVLIAIIAYYAIEIPFEKRKARLILPA